MAPNREQRRAAAKTETTTDLTGAGAVMKVTVGGETIEGVAGARAIAWLELHGHNYTEMGKMGPLSAFLLAWAVLNFAHALGDFTGDLPTSFDDFLLRADVTDLGEAKAPGASDPAPGGEASAG